MSLTIVPASMIEYVPEGTGSPATIGQGLDASFRSVQRRQHGKRIRLRIPSQFLNYAAIIAAEGVSYLYPQGICVDEQENALWIGYGSSAGSASYNFFVKYDLTSGVQLGYLKAGRSYCEGFAVVHEGASTFLYTRLSSGSSVSNLGKYDLTGFALTGGTPPLATSFPVRMYFQMSYHDGFFYVENTDAAIGSVTSRTSITKYDASFNPVGMLELPMLLAGGDDAGKPKRQAFAVGKGFVVGSMGGTSAGTPSGMPGLVKYLPDGVPTDILLYDPVKYRTVLDSLTNVPTTRIENEGCAVLADGTILTLQAGNGAEQADGLYYLMEEMSTAFDSQDFSPAASEFNFPGDLNDYWPSRGVNGVMMNPLTGATMASLADVTAFMAYAGCRRFSFYTTSFAGILDFELAVLPAYLICSVIDANNGTYFYTLLGNGVDRKFLVNGAPLVQAEINPKLSGFYTPTLTAGINVDSLTAFELTWLRVNDAVTITGRVTVDPTAAGDTYFYMTLPIGGNFTSSNDAGGSLNIQAATTVAINGCVYPRTGGFAQLLCRLQSPGTSAQSYTIHATYRVRS